MDRVASFNAVRVDTVSLDDEGRVVDKGSNGMG